VLSIGAPRCFLEEKDINAAKSVTKVDIVKLNEKVNSVLKEHLESGRQLGVAVVAYYRGKIVVHVTGGVHRTSCGKPTWLPVIPSTRFMIQSVTKSVCACGVLSLVSKGYLNYEDKVASIWPEFASEHPSKQSLTVAEALSHRGVL
jgi:CubicO group peptidase (beta-lactamase class C family)